MIQHIRDSWGVDVRQGDGCDSTRRRTPTAGISGGIDPAARRSPFGAAKRKAIVPQDRLGRWRTGSIDHAASLRKCEEGIRRGTQEQPRDMGMGSHRGEGQGSTDSFIGCTPGLTDGLGDVSGGFWGRGAPD